MRRAAVFLSLIAAACGAPTKPPLPSPLPPPRPVVVEPTVVELIANLERVYLTAMTYADRGRVSTLFQTSRGDYFVEKHFKIAFVRDGTFRYEFREGNDPSRSYVVWSDPNRTLTRWYVKPGVKPVSDLGLALAGATGVSSGSAHKTPRLLLPDVVGGRSITQLRDPRIAGLEPIDGHPCWKVVDKTVTLWIDQRTFVLRRDFERLVLDRHTGVTTETTTTYAPIIDRPIDPALLTQP